MDDDRHGGEALSRRRLLGTGAAVASAAAAGCLSGAIPGSDDGDGAYSVTMPPVGEVEFDAVPETWVANNGSWADMGIALGQEPPEAVWLTGRYHTQYYDPIPGLEVDKSDMVSLSDNGVNEELFYEFEADVHVIDPNFLTNRFPSWESSDITKVSRIAPFFGNSIFSTGYDWHEGYEYLSLYDAFEKMAELFQEMDRYEALDTLHDEFQSTVADAVPAETDRPSVAVMWGAGDEPVSFSPYIVGEGTGFKHLRELGVDDAFAEADVRDFHSNRGAVDFETLFEVDPEVILLRGQEAKTAEEFENTVVSFFENHDTARQLTAVENGDVYRAGGLYQGPITTMVLTERLGSDLYGIDEPLFDHERVAEIVDGDV
ncbi:ABC transporter substrate-binding protein [Salinarchaeum laminariae]|uniref:ABC transporter substrate-binding protein n=1 Tax=Salinarchaeum laminariae TaxID=869888 RepID=UPI0020BE63E1|nr:ABC transporter substrate-binding protein [Salinarchaeum laminariae]